MLATLLETRPVTGRDTCYIFHCPAIAQTARPGQFVELKLTEGFQTPFLRRPISLFDTDGKETFSLLVRSVGQGTEWMRTWTPGRTVDVLGPLGRSFRWTPDMRTCVLVAGGIGLAPMGLLARRLLEGGLREMRGLRRLTEGYYTRPRDGTYTAAHWYAPRRDSLE